MSVREGLLAIGLFLYLLVGATGWGQLGMWLLSRWGRNEDRSEFPGSTGEAWYLASVLGVGIVSWLSLFLGLAGFFYPATAWGLLALGWLVGVVIWIRSRRRRPRQFTEVLLQQQGSTTRQRVLNLALILLGLGSLLYMLLVHGFVPPHDWDEIAYHLAAAKIYVRAHGIVYIPDIRASNWPMNTEMVFTLGLLLGSELVAHLITWWMTLWTAGGLYLVGRRFLDRRIGLLAATLYLLAPLVKRLSGTGLIDVSLAFYGTATVLAYAHYREDRSLRWVALLALFSGLAAGSKLMAGALPLILGLLVVLNALAAPRLTGRSLLTRLAVVAGLGFLMVGPWYVRTYVYTGNPIWPFLYDILGGRNWDALGREYHSQVLHKLWSVELPPSLVGFARSFYYLVFEPDRLGGYHGGFGQVLLGLAAFSLLLVVACRKVPRLVYGLLVVSGLFYAMWFFLIPSHQLRYLFLILPALALLAAFAFYAIWDHLSHSLLQWLLAGILLVSLAKDFPLFEGIQRGTLLGRLPYLAGDVPRDVLLDRWVGVMPAIRYANANLPPDAVILLLPFENRGYYLDRAYVWGHPIAQRLIRFEQYDQPEELASDLRAKGITHILDNPEWLYTELRFWDHDRALMLALEAQCGERMAAWGDIVLYHLVECHR